VRSHSKADQVVSGEKRWLGIARNPGANPGSQSARSRFPDTSIPHFSSPYSLSHFWLTFCAGRPFEASHHAQYHVHPHILIDSSPFPRHRFAFARLTSHSLDLGKETTRPESIATWCCAPEGSDELMNEPVASTYYCYCYMPLAVCRLAKSG
jgi:hypothetical protein